MCSQRAPGLLHLVDRRRADADIYELAVVVSSEIGFDQQARVAAAGVPIRAHSIHEFYRRHDADLYHDFRMRARFDRELVGLLSQFSPDVVLLDGYLYLLTREFLDVYPGRVLNLHFSDLRLRRADGRPLYCGIRAVRDALIDGRTATKATVHLVNDEPDGGPPLVESWPFPVSPLVHDALAWGARDMLKAYAFAHQEWMMRAAAGPLMEAALRLIAEQTVDLHALASMDPSHVIPRTVDRDGHISHRHAA
jgi:folate-dependent phosphoribosylglycinamide formyltransferase PurN